MGRIALLAHLPISYVSAFLALVEQIAQGAVQQHRHEGVEGGLGEIEGEQVWYDEGRHLLIGARGVHRRDDEVQADGDGHS